MTNDMYLIHLEHPPSGPRSSCSGQPASGFRVDHFPSGEWIIFRAARPLKRGLAKYVDALERPETLTRYSLKGSLPFEGVLYLAPQRSVPPRWLAFLEQGARNGLRQLYNASASGILLIRIGRRLLAFTFGYGRSLLLPDKIERSFGLRVVLNTVGRDGLLSVDTRIVQELTVHTRRQTSRTSGIAQFGVDKEEDLLGAVSGVPRDLDLAATVTGADALQLRTRVRFADLGDKGRQLLRQFRSDDYKRQGFEFVDHVRRVNDPALVDRLDSDVVTALNARDFEGVHMAPPEVIAWEAVDGFSFVRSADPEPDLRIESFFEQIRGGEEISVERLARQRVLVHSTGAGDPIPRWPVYRVLVVERQLHGHRYVLSGGEWYEIESAFGQSVANRVDRIQAAGLDLPPARPGEKEPAYNLRAARLRGIYRMDRRLARMDGDPIELCDLYTTARQFVHVKRWTASSTLSHLFAQGKVSAETLISDERFRQEARRLLGERATAVEAHIPHGRPDPARYQIVFAIIKGGDRAWRRALPFFSQLHLVRTAESLRRLGFEVRLQRIVIEQNVLRAE